MRTKPLVLALVLLASVNAAMAQQPGQAATQSVPVQYRGLRAYRLSDGRSEAVVVPALGRVMRYGLKGGKNLLWNASSAPGKAGEWRNWGGDKSWPAPQSRWPLSIGHNWPPHPAWDGEAYAATVLPGGRLLLTSGVWPRWQIRMVREFSFDPQGNFVISQTYEKLGGEPVEMAIWSITQIATPEAIYIPANPQSAYRNQFHWLMKPDAQNKVLPDISTVNSKLLRVRPNGGGMYKVGIDAPAASLVAVTDGIVFSQRAARPEGSYPDGAEGSGFPVEIFDIGGTGRDHYMETELLSPLRTFYAGSRWTHTVKWSVRRLDAKESDLPDFMQG